MNAKSLFNFDANKKINLNRFFPKLKEQSANNLISISLSLISVIFFGVFAINPTLGTISEISKKLDDSKFVNTELTQKISNLTQLQQQYALIRKKMDTINEAIPTSAQTAILIAQVQALSQKSKVQLKRVQILPVEIASKLNKTSYNVFSFSIDATGSKQTINNFLINLNNFNRLILITNYSIIEDSFKTNSYRIDLRGKAFFKF